MLVDPVKLTFRCRSLSTWAGMRAGAQQALPLVLILTFVLLPSTANRIFRSFLCDAFGHDDFAEQEKRYLSDDLSLECDSEAHRALRRNAFIFMVIW